MNKPKIAVTMGDPAGIGPEITVRALADAGIAATADCFLIGDRSAAEEAIAVTGLRGKVSLHSAKIVADADFRPGVVNLMDVGSLCAPVRYGQIDAGCGRAAYDYIERAISLAMTGRADAVATAPINKESLRAAGVPYIGHTEIFGALTGTPDPLTMFETGNLRIFFLTRHVSLRQMLDLISADSVVSCAKRCFDTLRRLGVTEGTMAIAGLNPHGGEHGLFGDEEMREILPAVRRLRAEGYAVEGPIGADSVFHQAAQGKYSCVLSLYHDQGHIAAKTLDFERTVSVTGGMPILRTSVDHGTAFDIAGRGIASAVSMCEAIRVAARYAPNFLKK